MARINGLYCSAALFVLYSLTTSPVAFSDIAYEYFERIEKKTHSVRGRWDECLGRDQYIRYSSLVSNTDVRSYGHTSSTSADLTVNFYGASLNIGREIENRFQRNHTDEVRSEVENTITIPAWKYSRYEFDVVENWVVGRLRVTENRLLFSDRVKEYPYKRLQRRSYKNRRTYPVGDCLPTETVSVRKSGWGISGFKPIRGDCEMSTHRGDYIHVDLIADLSDAIRVPLQPANAVHLNVIFRVYEGDGSKIRNTIMEGKRLFPSIYFPKRGWRVHEIRAKSQHIDIEKFHARTGVSHGDYRLINPSLDGRSFLRNVWYHIDQNGDDCKKAWVNFDIAFDVVVKMIPDSR